MSVQALRITEPDPPDGIFLRFFFGRVLRGYEDIGLLSEVVLMEMQQTPVRTDGRERDT